MAEEEAPISSDTNAKKTTEDMESKIKAAMHSRIPHFRKQSDSFTFESVRRLLEKDLELEAYSLDKHKRFVKQCLLQGLDELDDGSKTSGGTTEAEVFSTRESFEGFESKEDVKEPCVEGKESLEDSDALKNLTREKRVESEAEDEQGIKDKVAPSERTITKAILKRASFIRLNSEKVTMAGVRRLLEEDLKLGKKTLDPYKKFIGEKIDEMLETKETSEYAGKLKNGRSLKKNSSSKASSKISIEETSSTPGSESEDIVEEEVSSKKKNAPKGKMRPDGGSKRQRSTKEPNVPRKKQKARKPSSENGSEDEEGGNVSNNSHGQSSDEKPTKKKGGPTPVYGKRVEHLKSTIKSCAMSIPPSIYRRIKQVPENKRETSLIKELEEILSKEGLSASPSEKEIKEVRKKKERARELEGIDMSNIVSSSRRRSTTSFIAAPKPKIPDENVGDDDSEDADEDDDDDEEINDNGDDDDELVDNDDDDSARSQSEELNEGEDSD